MCAQGKGAEAWVLQSPKYVSLCVSLEYVALPEEQHKFAIHICRESRGRLSRRRKGPNTIVGRQQQHQQTHIEALPDLMITLTDLLPSGRDDSRRLTTMAPCVSGTAAPVTPSCRRATMCPSRPPRCSILSGLAATISDAMKLTQSQNS